MNSVYQMIIMIVVTPMILIWIFCVNRYGKIYKDWIQILSDSEEYSYAELFGLGFGILELFHYDSTSEKAVEQIKKMAIVKGEKYAKFHHLAFMSQKITYSITVFIVALLLAVFDNSVEAILFGIIFAFLIPWYLNDDMNDKILEREDALLRDFPQVLSKLTLLVNSGMNLKEAWFYVAQNGEGVFYEEMRKTCNEMDTGTAELRAYENFAKRCELKEIKRFASSVTQNMIKGGDELTVFLSDLSSTMWNEKRNMAKRKGEAANSKLMMPTMLIFVGILILIMVPMFTSMNLG